jgi:cytochrome P450
LLDEVGRVTGGAAPTRQHAARLSYVGAIVSETLRLYPPLAMLAREALQDDIVRKRRVRKGSLLIVPTWVLHRQVDQWRHPHAFRPERFLDPGERPDRMAFIPFSAGPRTCLGMAIAMVEATIVLATLFQRFRFSLPPGATVRPVCRLTTKPEGGMRLVLERR